MNFGIDPFHTCCAVSPLKDLVIVSAKKSLKGYKNGKLSFTIQQIQLPTINSMIFSHDAKILYTGGSDGSIWRWDMEIKKKRGVLDSHKFKIQTLSISTSGDYLFSGSKIIKIYDLKKLKLIKEFKMDQNEEIVKIFDSGEIGKLIIFSKVENEKFYRGYTYNYKEDYIIYSSKLPDITDFHYNPQSRQIYLGNNQGYLEVLNSQWIPISKKRFGKNDLLINNINDKLIVFSSFRYLNFLLNKDLMLYNKIEIPSMYYQKILTMKDNIYLESEDNISIIPFSPPFTNSFFGILLNQHLCNIHFFHF